MGAKKEYGLIGFPLGHSFSRNYFTSFFEREGLSATCDFLNFPLESIESLPEMLREHPALQGFFVTIPYKQAVIPYLTHIDPAAAAIGAVNCVKIDRVGNDCVLTGYNTDYFGFRQSLSDLLRSQPTEAFVLGTGGASKAVCRALSDMEIPYRLVSRSAGNGAIGYDEIPSGALDGALVVNATPLGTTPNTDTCPPIRYEALTARSYLFDLVYNPGETLFLRKGRMQGALVKNGYQMLIGQAEKGWSIFCGRE